MIKLAPLDRIRAVFALSASSLPLMNSEVLDSTNLGFWSRDYGCSGAAYTLGSPGDSNLSDGDGSFNDAISSYFCKSG